MPRDERGIALMTVILMTAVIMVIVSLVGYKVLRSARGSATEAVKTKTYYAANAGLDNARVYLSDNYVTKNYWNYILDPDVEPGYTGAATNPAEDLYLRSTALDPNGFATDPPITVEVYIKDNNDGDNDYGLDTDQLVMVNVEARAADGSATMVEARLLYDDSVDAYCQLGGSAGREHYRDVSGVAATDNLADNSISLDLKQ